MSHPNKIAQALELMERLEAMKALYAELDTLVGELRAQGFKAQALEDGTTLRLRDNFAETNTVFRPAGVKRFELIKEKPAKQAKGAKP